MTKHRKTWSATEKLAIVNYAKKNGNVQAAREYSVSSSSIYKWVEAYDEHGESGLSRKVKSNGESEELRRLRRENQQLKEIVAEKELRLRIKDALLKKSQ